MQQQCCLGKVGIVEADYAEDQLYSMRAPTEQRVLVGRGEFLTTAAVTNIEDI